MPTPWDDRFETVLRAELGLAADAELEPDTQLVLYGLSSLGLLALAEQLSRQYGVPTRLFTQRAFRTPRSLWTFLGTATPAEATPVTDRTIDPADQESPLRVGRTLAEHFLDTARACPDAVCVRDHDTTLGYRRMLGEVTALARRLTTELPAPRRIAVLGERDARGYRGYLAVLFAGATVVPLSLESPPARNAAIAAEAEVAAVLVTGSPDEPALAEQLAALGGHTVLDGSGPFANNQLITGESPRIGLDELAYLLFTSGSTGKPKGVGISHRNVDAYLNSSMPRYRVGPGDVFSQIHELSFDLSVFELWGAWSSGAALTPVPRVQALDPAGTVDRQGVTVWTCTPSLLALAEQSGRLEPGTLDALRYVVFCGEPLTPRTLRATRLAAPTAVVDNTYGPTEATVWCSYLRFSPGDAPAPADGSVPIGRPCPGTDTLLLAPDGTAADTGELCLAGPQVFDGYLSPSMDSGRFAEVDGRRWYRTGDLARRAPDGCLQHLGRIDDQVKLHGFRIELAEIEHTASQLLDGRRTAAALAPDGAELALFIEATDDAGLDPDRLRRQLADRLPHYMVPARIHVLPKFMLTNNGKLDRAALSAAGAR